MPVNPLDQQRAMFTVQRGPRREENEMSVSVDASSIETVEPLDEISDPVEKEEYRARQTKIIALLGLDTISTALGFEDFTNYFTLRSIESELSQEIVEEHLREFNYANTSEGRPDRSFLNRAANQARAQRRAANILLRVHGLVASSAEGILSTNSNSKVNVTANRMLDYNMSKSNTTVSHSAYKYRSTEKDKIGVPSSMTERLEKFLGIQGFEDQRPSFQYLKLAADARSLLVPRTCPTYYQSNLRRPVGNATTQQVTPYRSVVSGWSSEGERIFTAEGAGVTELSIAHLQNPWRMPAHHRDHPLVGYTSEGATRIFSHLRNYPMSKNISALLYVIQRDHEMSDRLGNASQRMVASMSMPEIDGLMMDEAIDWAASLDAEGDRNILQGIAGQSKRYEVENNESRVTNLWFRVCSLEPLGITHYGRRGGSPRNPKLVSPGQLFQRLHGTRNALESISQMSEEQARRAEGAQSAVDRGASTGKNSSEKDRLDIVNHVGKFIEDMGNHLGRMIRTAEQHSPQHMRHLADQGEDTEDGGSRVFDLTRWKAYGRDSATPPEWTSNTNATGRDGRKNPWVARQWNKQAENHLLDSLDSDIATHFEFLRERYRNHPAGRRLLDKLEERWSDFESLANTENVYDAARAGVVNMNSSLNQNKQWAFASSRMSFGLALVMGAMKHRNLKNGSDIYVMYNKLLSRFRFAVFSRLTNSMDGLSSGDPMLSFDATLGKQRFGENQVPNYETIPMPFRDSYKAEGGRYLLNPLNTIGTSIPTSKIKSIEEVARLPDREKLEYFGYIKGSPRFGPKFRIPTGQITFEYGDTNAEQSSGLQQSRIEANTNDVMSVCGTLATEGVVENALTSEQSGSLFALNMAPGQAEEYYEIGWDLVARMVASSLRDMTSEMETSNLLTAQGLTLAGGQGLDTYITLYFEILGMIADCIPVTLCNSQDFFDFSPDKGEVVLLEDTDLAESIEERGADLDRTTTSFISKSGIDAVEPNSDGNFYGNQEHILDVYRRVAAAAYKWRGNTELYFDTFAQGGMNPDGTAVPKRGVLEWNLEGMTAFNFLRSAEANANARDGQAPQNDPTLDIAIVFPRRLKAILPGSSGFENYSSMACFRQIGRYLRSGQITGGSQFEKTGSRHSIIASYSSIDDTGLETSMEVQDQYIRACSSYLENLQISPTSTSVFELYKTAQRLLFNDLARETLHTSLSAYNEVVQHQTRMMDQEVSAVLSELVDARKGMDPSVGERMTKNLNGFDTVTSDRPLRTIHKLNPRGMALRTMNAGAVMTPGEDYDPEDMMKLTCYSEFTNTIKNLVIAYLDNYPIEDERETILVAGCPAGSDSKNLGKYSASLFSMRRFGSPRLESPKDQYAIRPSRVFQITGERDLQTDDDFNSQFTVERKYHMKCFLLPESFEGITDDDLFDVTDTKGWIRAIAKRARWFQAPTMRSAEGEEYLSPLRVRTWNQINREADYKQELDDMVESFILQWMTAMITGVMIDQDLLFKETLGAKSIDLVAPGTYSGAINRFKKRDSSSGREPILGMPSELMDQLAKINPIQTQITEVSPRNPNFLGLASGFLYGFQTDGDVADLVLDTYRTELDTVTGEEIRVPIKAEVKPWNIRLASTLFNSYMYKAPVVTSMMSSTPAFDYLMFMRLKKSDFENTGTTPVDLLSYRVEITNGKPARSAEG